MKYIVSTLQHIEKEHQPIPFWSWNDHLDEDELRRQVRWMKENGIGGFFMHARGGLKTPYLSDEWMKAVEVCCDEAKKVGMNAWAYDENGWPSGFAGGKLLEDPKNRDMFLTFSIDNFDARADISYSLSADKLIRVAHGNDGEEYLNLYLRTSASTVDILNPAVVKKFLQITHEQYREYFGTQFSEIITGFFTDEPQYYRAATPYTPMVAKYFRNVYGIDIWDQLGLLFVEKEGYRAFRYRYWLAMQTLMLDGFAKQVYTWCKDHGIRFTGHYVEEPTMGGQLMCCGGVMPFYEYEDMPGIDWLGRDTKNEVSPRQLGSAARQLGKKQTLTETFGCCGWNVKPAELKRIAGFQYACGVNMMCHHLLPYSEHGQRKKDYPAHFNPINPWIGEHFKHFNDYFSRLGYLLSESQEPVNVAMLHPMRSAYLNYKRGDNAAAIPESELDKDLQKACRSLSARGIAYHFLDETLFEKYGFVEDAQIGCGQCAYTYLVLPKILTMGAKTEELIRQFVANGGKVLLMDEKPAYLEGDPYSYDYLQSNCTMDEIIHAQPFCMQNPDTEVYCTYRIYDDKPFLFVQNASGEKRYTQRFVFQGGTRSFVALDPITMETKTLPLELTLEKNESALLFLSPDPAPDSMRPDITVLRFQDAAAKFTTNFYTLDTVRFSTNGKTFSDPVLCSDLCKKLLQERYEGSIHIRYEFEIKQLPDTLHLLIEENEAKSYAVNGHAVAFGKRLEAEPCVIFTDISPFIHEGINHFDTVLHWHQSEETYYALFGEGVTESLKNCIAYDSEIEAVYLAGHFGVYSHHAFEPFDPDHILGRNFYIGAVPIRICEPVTDGLPFFRGELTLTQELFLADPNIRLEIPGDYLTAKVSVNGQYAGELCFTNVLDISPWARAGSNEIRVTLTIGNRNLLGPLHSQESEIFVEPASFERNDIPSIPGGKPTYKFRRFYSLREN